MPKKVIYPELEAQLAKRGCYKMELAKLLGIMPRTLRNKLSGISHFTVEEAVWIQENWFSDKTVNELFRKGGEHHD